MEGGPQFEPGVKSGGGENIILENIQSWENKNFYDRLGVSTNATEEEIKKAFKKLSVKYHPDKVHNNEPLRVNYSEVQKRVSEAYNTLTNPKDKAKYDARTSYYSGGQQTYQRSRPEYSYTQQSAQHSKQYGQGEAKREFTEEEKISDFIAKTENDLKTFSISYSCGEIKKRIDTLSRNNVSKEKLIKAVEKMVVQNFIEQTKKNLDTYSIEHVVSEIEQAGNAIEKAIEIKKKDLFKNIEGIAKEKFIEHTRNNLRSFGIEYVAGETGKSARVLEKIGINNEELIKSVEEIIIQEFIRSIEKNFKNFGMEYIAAEIQKSLKALDKINISREKLLKIVDSIVIPRFAEYTQKELSSGWGIDYVSSKAKEAINAFSKCGFNKEKLTQSVRDMVDKNGQKLKL